MLQMFRNFFNSRFGVMITLGFLGLIALAFASADVTGSQFGGILGGDKLAKVGKSSVESGEVQQTMTNALESERQKSPGLTMKQFIAAGGLTSVVNAAVERIAMWEWGTKAGMAVGDRLIGSELAQIPAFMGPDGKFSEAAYRGLLRQRGLNDDTVRNDIARGLMARQLLVPASFGADAPQAATLRYLSLLREKRSGLIITLPSEAFAAGANPDEAALQAFFAANSGRYKLPERRTLRYALLGEATLGAIPAPTEAEISKRYKDNTAVYAPSEMRTLTQVVVPAEAGAKALVAAAPKGLAEAARAAGLEPNVQANVTRDKLATQSSKAIADAVFAAAKGALVGPVKGPLGWYVIHLDGVERNAGKTLDQARAEITLALTKEKRRAALADKAVQVEDSLGKGAGLADIAKQMGLTVETTEPLVSTGAVYGKPGATLPDAVRPLVPTAFGMEQEGQPQIAEVAKGETFAIFDVGRITAAAPPPFAEIRPRVLADYRMDKGFGAAGAAADKVLAALAKGTDAAAAVKALGLPLPPPRPVEATREQMLQMGKNVPPALNLFFNMARGKTAKLAGGGKAGWFVVVLNAITPADAKVEDPLFAGLRKELGEAMGREYAEQMRAAIRTEVGVKRNEGAIAALRQKLVGTP